MFKYLGFLNLNLLFFFKNNLIYLLYYKSNFRNFYLSVYIL